MKISKLYCNQPFKNVVFNTENGKLNVVFGDASRKSNRKDSHNLGKTRLILLIDFLLLKSVNKKDFFLFTQRKEKGKKLPIYDEQGGIQYVEVSPLEVGQLLFEQYEFYLEIKLNDGRYVTIKRSVATPTKISFKLQNNTNQEFIFYKKFDYDNIALDKAERMLNDWLNFDFCKNMGEDYRRILNYSLRMQGDYDVQRNSLFQLSKFSTGQHKSWKPLVFALLGFDKKVAKDKYDLEDLIEKQKEFIQKQAKESGIRPQDRDSLTGQIQVKEALYKTLNEQLSMLNFYQQDKGIIKDLVGKIETDIAQLNTQLYGVQYDIGKLQRSIKNGFSFDLNRVKDLFEEMSIHFSGQLTKNYEQLIEFNQQITVERNAQIRLTLQEKEQEQKVLNKELMALHQQKIQYLDLIQDTSLFKKYRTYQQQIFDLNKDLSRLQSKLETLDDIESKREQINQTKGAELRAKIEALKHIVSDTSKNEPYGAIRMAFARIVKQITFDEAYISIRLNTQNNLEFDCKYSDNAKDEGNTYYKLLCIAFDLALHISYSAQSYFRFLYHDDAFANLDNSRRESLMQTIRTLSTQYQFQYIFSIIEDDVPNDPLFEWQSGEVILKLDDKSDMGKLFYMNY